MYEVYTASHGSASKTCSEILPSNLLSCLLFKRRGRIMLKTWSKPRAGNVVLPLKKMIYEFLKTTVRSQTPLPGPGLYRMEGKADVRDGAPLLLTVASYTASKTGN